MSSDGKLDLFILNLYSDVGGGEQLLYHLLENIDRRRYNPVVAFNSTGPFVGMVEKLGVKTIQLRYPTVMLKRLIRPRVFREVLSGAREIRRHLRIHPPDVIQCGDVLALMMLGPAAKKMKIPIVYSVIFFHEWSRMLLFNLLAFFLVRKIIVNSDMVRRDLLRRTIFLSGKVETIHNGVDARRFRPLADGEKNVLREELGAGKAVRLVGMVARFDPAKGHILFVEAAHDILKRMSDIRFVVAGDVVNEGGNPALAQCRENVLRRCRELGLADKVIFLGRRDDIAEVMRSLDVVVVPSVREGFGLVLLEGLASGAAVVSGADAGVLEVLAGNPGVFVAERRDASSFAEKIAAALDYVQGHPVRLADEITEQLTWERCARAFERCYAEAEREGHKSNRHPQPVEG